MAELNEDFEQLPEPQTMPVGAESLLSGGVVVIGGYVDTDVQRIPVVVFRFARADGSGFYPDVVLGSDAADLGRLPALVRGAVESAITRAQED